MASDGTSPWVYIGIGCLAFVLLAVGSCVGLVWFGANKAKEAVEELEDPEKRAERVAEVLGADEMPDGYYPGIAMSIPFVMDMAILADTPPEVSEADGFEIDDASRAFVYVNTRTFGDDLDDLRAVLRGENVDRDPLENIDLGVNVDLDGEAIARGEIEAGAITMLWAAQRDDADHDGERVVAIESMILVECGTDTRMRLGIWTEPLESADPGAASDELDLTGSPGDAEAIREFMGHFDLCR